MQITQFNSAVQNLYHQVQRQVHGKILIEENHRQEAWIAFDQSGHRRDKAGNVHIEITRSSAPNFTLAHELRHLQIEMSNLPSIDFPVTTQQPELDQQLQITALSLLGSVEHVLIMQQQRENNEVTAQVQNDFTQGIAQKLSPETTSNNQYFIYNLLMLLDALTFSEGQDLNHWQEQYPQAFEAAQQLYQMITLRLQPTAFSVRRQEVALLNSFNELLQEHNYQSLPYNDFVTLEPVLSQRQLRLTLGQVFKIKALDFFNRETKQQAYALIGNKDIQNAGLIKLAKLSPVEYQRLYQTNVKDFLQTQQIDFSLR